MNFIGSLVLFNDNLLSLGGRFFLPNSKIGNNFIIVVINNLDSTKFIQHDSFLVHFYTTELFSEHFTSNTADEELPA